MRVVGTLGASKAAPCVDVAPLETARSMPNRNEPEPDTQLGSIVDLIFGAFNGWDAARAGEAVLLPPRRVSCCAALW